MDFSEEGELCFADIGRRGIYRLKEDGKAELIWNVTGSDGLTELDEDTRKESPIYYNFDMGSLQQDREKTFPTLWKSPSPFL